MSKKSKASAVSYDEGLIHRLKDPEYAVAYLNAILSDKGKGLQARLLNALQLVAKAHGITEVSKRTKLQRESLRKALSERGNPTLSTLFSLIKTFGLQIKFEPLNCSMTPKTELGESALENRLDKMQQTLNEIQKTTQDKHTVIVLQSSSEGKTISQAAEQVVKTGNPGTTTVSMGVRGAQNVH